MSDDPISINVLKPVSLAELRKSIAPERYQRSLAHALGSLSFDGFLYVAAVMAIFLTPHPLAKIFFGLLAGSAVAFLFVWGHDAAHGALFTSQRVARILGTLSMLPSFNMYRLWAHGHNRVHHGFTSLSIIDWIWRPCTPAEYQQKTWWQRWIYRLERSPYTCALHYLLRVWWPGMIRFQGDEKNRQAFRNDKILTLLFFVSYSIIAWWLGGFWTWIAAVVLPFVVFNYYIALFVFLHHTHPDLPFFIHKEEWSPSIGQLHCSTIVRCSRISEWLTHNILIHTPHHVDPRIPFYHLKAAYEDLRSQYGAYMQETRFSFREVRNIFRQCQLYDFESHHWIRFRELGSWQRAQEMGDPARPWVGQLPTP